MAAVESYERANGQREGRTRLVRVEQQQCCGLTWLHGNLTRTPRVPEQFGREAHLRVDSR